MARSEKNNIPDWFELSNYSTKLTDQELALEIYIRAIFLKDGKPQDYCDIFLEAVINKNSAHRAHRKAKIVEAAKKIDQGKFIIKESTALELYEQIRIMRSMQNYIEYPIDRELEALDVIVIDKDTTNDQLKKAFTAYLKKRKETSTIEKDNRNFNQNSSYAIQHINALAIFDLMLWKESKNPKLTYGKICEAVYYKQDIQEPTKKIKAVLEVIQRFFNDPTAERLYAQRHT